MFPIHSARIGTSGYRRQRRNSRAWPTTSSLPPSAPTSRTCTRNHGNGTTHKVLQEVVVFSHAVAIEYAVRNYVRHGSVQHDCVLCIVASMFGMIYILIRVVCILLSMDKHINTFS